MRFYEYETWKLKEDVVYEDYDKLISDWFKFLTEHKEEMFAEWVSAKYFRQTDREGNPTGTYIMVFEYDSLEGHHAYKERRKNWDGPYEEYKKVDPYQYFFNLDTVTTEYWQPMQADNWFDYDK